MIYWYHVMVCVLDLHFTLEWPWLGRNGSVHITVPIGATFTKLAPTVHLDIHDLLVPRGGLCPWPTFQAWVTMVRKKWLSPYYSTYWSYIHQTCTNCSSWHDLLIPCDGFVSLTYISRLIDHGKEEMVKSILQYLLLLHSLNLHQLFILTWSTDATWWCVSLTYISCFSYQDPNWQ